jgi:hypothetical protein
MDPGRCGSCGRPYTPGEVAGLGVLRSRPAAQGGPRIEFECPGCKDVLVLVPHGGGRYAPPGEPPPPPPTEDELRLPWRRTAPSLAAAAAAAAPAAAAPPPPERSPPPPAPATAPPRARAEPRPRLAQDDDAPLLDPFEACAILGIAPAAAAEAIEAAYRERALQCHPDKVAHLDPDIQAVARRKFRRLKEARDLLLG